MKTLNVYIARDLLVATLAAVAVLTFVMLSANLFRAFELVSRGVSPVTLLRFLALLMPDMLRYTIPFSVLVATVLVFSRLSADREIVAMKASGISLWQIITPGLLLSMVLSAVCFWLATSLAPYCRHLSDVLKRRAAVRNPLALIEPGRFIDEIPGITIRVGHREGDRLYNIHIYAYGDEGAHLEQTIYAKEGTVVLDEENRDLILTLEDARYGSVDLSDAADEDVRVEHIATERIRLPIDYDVELDRKSLQRKTKRMDMKMLFARIHLDEEAGRDVTPLYVQIHSRMSLALSPLAFLLLGVPFAIRSRRSEVSVSLLMCIVLGTVFYAFILLADALKHRAGLHPEFLVWLPNIVYQAGGIWALVVIGRR